MSIWWVVLIGVLLTVAVVYVWTLAVRIDRLHRRLAASAVTLQLALVKRAAGSVQLARSGALSDSDSQLLLEAAANSLSSTEEPMSSGALPRYAVESRLSEVLREIGPELPEGSGDELAPIIWGELGEARYKLQVSRALHNQDVTLVRNLRARRVARIFHLAGFAPLPQYVDLDDNV